MSHTVYASLGGSEGTIEIPHQKITFETHCKQSKELHEWLDRRARESSGYKEWLRERMEAAYFEDVLNPDAPDLLKNLREMQNKLCPLETVE